MLFQARLCIPVCGDLFLQPQDTDTPSTGDTGHSEVGELPISGGMAAVSDGMLVGDAQWGLEVLKL